MSNNTTLDFIDINFCPRRVVSFYEENRNGRASDLVSNTVISNMQLKILNEHIAIINGNNGVTLVTIHQNVNVLDPPQYIANRFINYLKMVDQKGKISNYYQNGIINFDSKLTLVNSGYNIDCIDIFFDEVKIIIIETIQQNPNFCQQLYRFFNLVEKDETGREVKYREVVKDKIIEKIIYQDREIIKDNIIEVPTETGNCIICLDDPSNMCFSACGHVVCCEQCAKKVRKCPLCRQIGEPIKLYFSTQKIDNTPDKQLQNQLNFNELPLLT